MTPSILAITLIVAATGLASAQTSYFNLDNAVVNPTQSGIGTTFTYIGADPSGLYDVVVTVQNGFATSAIFSNPQGDSFTGFTAGGSFPDAAPYFTPSWNLNDGTSTGTFTASLTFQFSVFDTGTTNGASVDLYATTLDNDGGVNGNTSTVRERVIYGGSPTFLQVGSGETQDGNQFTATTTTNQPGIGTGANYRINALYSNTSTFSWTAQHLVTDLAANGGDSSRLSALQLGFTTVPEPGVSLLGLLSVTLLAVRRNRRPFDRQGVDRQNS